VSRWGRHNHLGLFAGLQILEKRCGCGGSTESLSVERNPFREEQLLQALAVVERRLDPQVCGARQDAFFERQDALYGEAGRARGGTVARRAFYAGRCLVNRT
jgi:hypothetical protein